MEFPAADRQDMLKALGQQVVVDDLTVDGLTIYAKFSNQYIGVDGDGLQFAALTPNLKVASSDIEGIVSGGDNGTRITVAGTDYRVTAVQPRDSGFSILILTEA